MFVGRRRKRWRRVVLTILLALLVVLSVGFSETYRLETKEYTFSSPDLPQQFDGTRIALVTDIHRGPFFSQDRVRSLVDRVNALEPDLIVLGGDYVFMRTRYAASCFVELDRLDAPLGCYAVLGNHDYGEHEDGGDGPALVRNAIADSHITLLENRAEWLEKDGARIRIGGVGDYSMDTADAKPTFEGTEDADFVLLVSHNPDVAEHIPAGAVDLMLSGHTHGGQVTIFGLWAFHVPSDYGQKYRTGAVTNGRTTVIVSNGIGTSTIPPLRFFARPQIVLITLQAGTVTGVSTAGPGTSPGPVALTGSDEVVKPKPR